MDIHHAVRFTEQSESMVDFQSVLPPDSNKPKCKTCSLKCHPLYCEWPRLHSKFMRDIKKSTYHLLANMITRMIKATATTPITTNMTAHCHELKFLCQSASAKQTKMNIRLEKYNFSGNPAVATVKHFQADSNMRGAQCLIWSCHSLI